MSKNYDLTGMRFGKLTVLRKGESKGPGRTAWTCLCDCGNIKDIRADALKSGATKSCGRCRETRKVDMTVPVSVDDICKNAKAAGLTFGQYVAAEYASRISGGRRLHGRIGKTGGKTDN